MRNEDTIDLNRREFVQGAAGVCVTAALAGSPLAQAEQPVKGGHLVLGLGGGGTTDSYDPATYTGQVPINYGRLWGEGLIDTDESGNGLMLVLAESYEAVESTRVWRFTVRKGIEFHNGQPLTADDVVKSLQRHSDENSRSPAFGSLRTVKSIKQESSHSLLITLRENNADLPFLLTRYHLIIQPGGGYDDPAAIFLPQRSHRLTPSVHPVPPAPGNATIAVTDRDRGKGCRYER